MKICEGFGGISAHHGFPAQPGWACGRVVEDGRGKRCSTCRPLVKKLRQAEYARQRRIEGLPRDGKTGKIRCSGVRGYPATGHFPAEPPLGCQNEIAVSSCRVRCRACQEETNRRSNRYYQRSRFSQLRAELLSVGSRSGQKNLYAGRAKCRKRRNQERFVGWSALALTIFLVRRDGSAGNILSSRESGAGCARKSIIVGGKRCKPSREELWTGTRDEGTT